MTQQQIPQQPTPIKQTFASVTSGFRSGHGALSVIALVGDDVPGADYLTLDEALALAVVEITEVSEAGRVPELRVLNRGARPVLIVDGEELVGAKQNRVTNLSVLVAGESTTTIPVSCVEAARWSRRSMAFASAPRAHYSAGRASRVAQVTCTMAATGQRLADQGVVWQDIAAKAGRMRASSATGAMSAIFEHHADAVDAFVESIRPVDRQRGAIFVIDGKPRGLELFDRASTFRRLAPKLVRSYAIDALESPQPAAPAPSDEAIAGFLGEICAASCQSFPAVALGEDLRMSGRSLAAAALVAEGYVVHLAAFRLGAGE